MTSKPADAFLVIHLVVTWWSVGDFGCRGLWCLRCASRRPRVFAGGLWLGLTERVGQNGGPDENRG